jgi:hypothetical protein
MMMRAEGRPDESAALCTLPQNGVGHLIEPGLELSHDRGGAIAADEAVLVHYSGESINGYQLYPATKYDHLFQGVDQ